MDDPAKPASPLGSGPSPEEMETKWRNAMDAVTEAPQSPDVLLHAASLAEQMGRKPEAYGYYLKAIRIDPSKSFLIGKLRQNAATPEQREEAARLAKRPTSFARALDDVFVYPFRGGGVGILLLGAVFVWGTRLLFQYNPFVPLISIAVGALVTAYLSMFYVDVCTSTATGSEDLPEWPDLVRFREFLLDWTKLATASLAAFLPIVIAGTLLVVVIVQNLPKAPPQPPPAYSGYFVDGRGFIRPSPGARPVPREAVRPSLDEVLPPGVRAAAVLILVGGGVFTLLGLAYLPMATLANCVYGHPFACFNPVFIGRSMFAAPGNYAICVVAYFGTTILYGVLEILAAGLGLFLFTGLPVVLVELYCVTVQMRILGVFYRMNQSKLGWMGD